MIGKIFANLAISAVILTAVACSSTAKKELTPAQKRAKLYYNQGTRDLVSQDYTKALTNLLEASSLDPENSDIHNNLGMAYYFKKSSSRAISHIKKAIDLNPKNTDAKLNLATIYMAQNSLSQAESLYRQILEDLTYEGQQRTHYNLGVINLARKQEKLAIKEFKTALEIDPNYCPAHFKMAEMAYEKMDYKKALRGYRDAGMGTCVKNPEPVHGQIESLIKLERYPAALEKLQDLQERFAMTKYESYARATIKKVKALQARKHASPALNKEEQKSQSYSKRIDGEIKAVDF